MPRFLFLDDDPDRHIHFDQMSIGANVSHVWTADECQDALMREEPFDCVFLDHDLGGEIFVTEVLGSGTQVAQFIRDFLPAERLPKRVIVHSLNPDGALRMERTIAERGVDVKRMPFSFRA